uniref:NADH-ubiquinone oxidoreductase chain 3 n=1 Tax=Campodea lubbockii TaxID=383858 RepID=Q0ZCZ9_9HEXA|nr:NADH dehydrogenase subunit 3 [Campodea lubbockii]ABF49581.1 NADH dehydrogenase subunit 3 [Campodea lubbockii]
MYKIFFLLMIYTAISSITMTLATILSKKNIYEREKFSPFECGFDPKKSSRIPFSLQFFLISILFLIFDIEIAFIIPMVISINFSTLKLWLITSLVFFIILIIDLLRMKTGSLNWT